MRFQLKPRRTISAIQYTGDNKKEVHEFSGGRTHKVKMQLPKSDKAVEILILQDQFGHRVIENTNWLCEQVDAEGQDELLIVPDEAFQRMFQPVE